ncbi:MAG TPA: TetR/AcrR family transcriptional regulator [Spirochaetota bacterium]|nr:TetR/AcrR family transcriptional regulator [Spirochaetota bacterium]
MKPAFFNIAEIKRETIIKACISEFGEYGYEKSSTDRIIRLANISKGGLYEYISSKEELFLYITEFVFQGLYSFIRNKLEGRQNIPEDILERFRIVSEIAIDFYIANPSYIKFIVTTGRLNDPSLEKKVKAIFAKQFNTVFGNVSEKNLRYDKAKITEMLIWLLAKTRDDFLHAMEQSNNTKKLKKIYLENWDFYLSILKTGIYS